MTLQPGTAASQALGAATATTALPCTAAPAGSLECAWRNPAAAQPDTNPCERKSCESKHPEARECQNVKTQEQPGFVSSVHVMESGTSPRCNTWQLFHKGQQHPGKKPPWGFAARASQKELQKNPFWIEIKFENMLRNR